MRSPVVCIHQKRQRGAAMVEFILAGIASMTLMISTVHVALAMWNYHTLAYAVHETNRYIASHGRDCSLGGNTCTITVGNVVTKLTGNAIGLLPANLNLTLTSASGTVHTCSPVSNCNSDATQWPPVANFDNMPPNNTTVKASYTFNLPIVALWYSIAGKRISSITMTSQSQIPMLF
jgi:TadE-like protein